MNWKIGDRAIFIGGGSSDEAGLGGQIVDLLEYSAYATFEGGVHISRAWRVDSKSPPAWVAEKCLRHIPDDYTRFHEALISGKWSDCEFNPMVEIEQ